MTSQPTTSTTPQHRGYCQDCGTPLAPTARYCPSCGASRPMAPASVGALEPPAVSPASAPSPAPLREEESTWWMPPTPTPAESVAEPVAANWTRSRSFSLGRRSLAAAIGALAVVVLLVAGALAYVHNSSNASVEANLTAGRTNFAPVVDRMSSAHSVGDLARIGTVAGSHARQLQSLDTVTQGSSQGLGAQVHAVLAAEQNFASTAGGLSKVSSTDLTSWATLQPQLAKAARTYTSAVSRLRASDSAAAAAQPNLAAAMTHMQSVVTRGVTANAAATTTGLLQTIAAAKTTSDVRDAAASALALRDTVATAEKSAGTASDGKAALGSLGRILSAVQPLESLSANNLKAWDSARGPLVEAVSAFPQSSAGYPALSSAGSSAVDHMDGLVRHATAVVHHWKQNLASAAAAKQNDAAALQTYSANMQGQINTYTGLRTDTGNFITRIENGEYITYHEAYVFLNKAMWARENVRSAMSSMVVPPDMQSAHAALIAVLDRAINAMQAAINGTRDAQYCQSSCYWRDTPGWRTFSSESSAISAQYATALQAWQGTLAQAEQAVHSRPLPHKPRV